MRMFDLIVVNTLFQPSRDKSTATYLSCVEGSEEDMKCTLNTKMNMLAAWSRVLQLCQVPDDGTCGSSRYNEKLVRKWIVPVEKKFVEKQIDYVMVSRR